MWDSKPSFPLLSSRAGTLGLGVPESIILNQNPREGEFYLAGVIVTREA